MATQFETVQAERLVKMFGPTRALAGVDVTLHAGEVTVLEGPNGSGKSTLVALLAQLARPSRGTVRYGSRTASRMGGPELRRQIGLLGHTAMIYPELTGRENLQLFGSLYGLRDASSRVDALLERFEIGRFADRPARTWSRGQKQRVALARALLHSPQLVLLDEPSTGLDARANERLVTAVDEERERGAILVLVTHDPALAERLGDRRIRLERGRVVEADG